MSKMMLDSLKQQIVELFAQTSQVTLTTGGIAGLQTSVLACAAHETNLYVLVPRTADHLVNIEHQPACIALTTQWELRGIAQCASLHEHSELSFDKAVNAEWYSLIEIHPTRLQILQPDGAGYSATIDID
jgi:hypothetical protein